MMMMMEKSTIPPHFGIKGSINHTFPKDLEERNVHIASTLTDWRRPKSGKLVVFLNNFSAAGGSTALLLEDGPLPVVGENNIPMSAKSQSSLKQNIRGLISLSNDKSRSGSTESFVYSE